MIQFETCSAAEAAKGKGTKGPRLFGPQVVSGCPNCAKKCRLCLGTGASIRQGRGGLRLPLDRDESELTAFETCEDHHSSTF